jgi:hypothetical protein
VQWPILGCLPLGMIPDIRAAKSRFCAKCIFRSKFIKAVPVRTGESKDMKLSTYSLSHHFAKLQDSGSKYLFSQSSFLMQQAFFYCQAQTTSVEGERKNRG